MGIIKIITHLFHLCIALFSQHQLYAGPAYSKDIVQQVNASAFQSISMRNQRNSKLSLLAFTKKHITQQGIKAVAKEQALELRNSHEIDSDIMNEIIWKLKPYNRTKKNQTLLFQNLPQEIKFLCVEFAGTEKLIEDLIDKNVIGNENFNRLNMQIKACDLSKLELSYQSIKSINYENSIASQSSKIFNKFMTDLHKKAYSNYSNYKKLEKAQKHKNYIQMYIMESLKLLKRASHCNQEYFYHHVKAAIKYKNHDQLQLLIALGADINYRAYNYAYQPDFQHEDLCNTAIGLRNCHWAISARGTDVFIDKTGRSRSEEEWDLFTKEAHAQLKYLVKKGVNTNITNKKYYNVNPILRAVVYDNDPTLTQILIAPQTNLHSKTKKNRTPLDIAITNAQSHQNQLDYRKSAYQICKMLQQAGAESSSKLIPQPSDEVMQQQHNKAQSLHSYRFRNRHQKYFNIFNDTDFNLEDFLALQKD